MVNYRYIHGMNVKFVWYWIIYVIGKLKNQYDGNAY